MKRGGPLRRRRGLTPKTSIRRSEFTRQRPASIRERAPEVVRAVEARSLGICEWCRHFEASDLHHRKRQSAGGPDTVENLVHLCRQHHDWVHANVATSIEYGLLIASWDPDPIEAWSPSTF